MLLSDKFLVCAGFFAMLVLLTGCSSSITTTELSAQETTKNATATTANAAKSTAASDIDPDAAQPVLVEFFTSEGCSSCPPADQVAQKLNQIARERKLPIYVLGYHIDYWNRLGWPDRFSSAKFTAVQREYARRLNLNSLYTPQAVVQGTFETVGSRGREVADQVSAQLATRKPYDHSLHLKLRNNIVDFEIRGDDPLPQETTLKIALVQKSARTEVKAGENRGRSLTHVNIVHDIHATKVRQPTGQITFNTPDDVARKELKVIGFLQNTKTGAIHAITQIDFAMDS